MIKLRTDKVLNGSHHAFVHGLNELVEKIEQHNYNNNDDIDVEQFVRNLEDERYEIVEQKMENEREIFFEKMGGYPSSNTWVTQTHKISLNALCDSLSGTLKMENDDTGFFNKILLKDKNKITEEGAFYFNHFTYKRKILTNGLIIFADRIDTKTGEIDYCYYFSWQGDSMMQLNNILLSNGYTFNDFVLDLEKKEFKPSRLDIAFDDYDSAILKMSRICKKLKSDLFRGTFKNKPDFINDTETAYLGLRQDLTIRFYDKTLETIKKYKLYSLEYIKNELPKWTRMELQTRKKYAKELFKDLCKYAKEDNFIAEVGRSWICKKLTFLSRNDNSIDTKKSRMSIAPFWREFSKVKLEVKATIQQPMRTIENTIKFVSTNNGSIATVMLLKDYKDKYKLNDDYLVDILNDCFVFKKEDKYLISAEQFERLVRYAQSLQDDKLLEYILQNTAIK